MPEADRISRTRGIASEEAPRTKSRRCACPPICLPNSLSFPAPNRMRSTVANSKENILLSVFIRGEDIGIFDALSWLSHHLHDGVSPEFVMRRFLMSSRRL